MSKSLLLVLAAPASLVFAVVWQVATTTGSDTAGMPVLRVQVAAPGVISNSFGAFGASGAIVADLDGDGRVEVLVSDDRYTPPAGSIAGGVHIFSSPGLVLKNTIVPPFAPGYPFPSGPFGESIAAGDMDGNGIAEVAVGMPTGGNGLPYVYLFRNGDYAAPWVSASASGYDWGWAVSIGDVSGDGKADLIATDKAGPLGIYFGPVNLPPASFPDVFLKNIGGSAFGMSLADLDGDGLKDVVLGDGVGPGFNGIGAIHVIHGGSYAISTPIAEPYHPGTYSTNFGWDLAVADLDGDGSQDIVAGAPYARDDSSGTKQVGEAFVFYGPDFKTWKSVVPPTPVTGELYGYSVAAGNFDFDPSLEVAISGPGALSGSGSPKQQGIVDIFAGDTMTKERSYAAPYAPGTPYSTKFGQTMAWGDLNGDQTDDLFVGAPQKVNPDGSIDSLSWSYEFFPQFDLGVDRISLSQAQGGTTTFTVRPNAPLRGQPYLLLLSATGTTPGFHFGQTIVPLNLDPFLLAFLLATLGAGNPSNPTTGWFGTLSRIVEPTATVAFTIPANAFPGLVGTRLWFAYLAGTSLQYASRPVAIEIGP